MGASRYQRDMKRILQEAEGRSHGWKKRALRRMRSEQDLVEVRLAGRVVGMRQRDSDLVICQKKSFHDEDAALASIAQSALMPGIHKRPARAYHCPHCGYWHLTSQRIPVWKTAAAVSVDDDAAE